MPLDPVAEKMLEMARAPGAVPLHEQSVEEMRQVTEQSAAGYDGAPVASVEWRDVGGVRCAVVTPEGTDGPAPVLAWFHGGGWATGSATTSLPVARDLAAGSGCVVVTADYRLAPEHPFPAAVEDALAVVRALVAEPGAVGGRPDRLAVGGDSAGGNLAAVAANELEGIRFQLLVYPVTDATMGQPSQAQLGDDYLLTASALRRFTDLYAGGADRRDPRMSPLLAGDDVLAQSCPAYVVTAEYDPLRDEGEAYAARLQANGVEAGTRRVDGQMHGFFQMGHFLPAGAAAVEEAAARLRVALSDAAG